jgi:hypothetical protein
MDILQMMIDNNFMKLKLFFLLLFAFSACNLQRVESQQINESSQAQPVKAEAKTPVLVELYTSEGCSSCPPADKLLAVLQKEQSVPNTEIITLAFHVDYWNYLGWQDKYSSPLFSQRQQFYAKKMNNGTSYTPQMVVDGSFEFVGSHAAKAKQFISEAAKTTKAKIELEKNGETLKVNISDIPKHENATVFLAIAEDNLASNVKRGENSGARLEHISVVRELQFLGNLPTESRSFSVQHPVQLQADWKKENLKLVVFIQEIQSRKIIGVNFSKFN